VLHKDIGHLTVVFKTLYGWVVTNAQPDGLMVLAVTSCKPSEDFGTQLKSYGYKVLRMHPKGGESFILRPSIMSCVSFAKYAMGIKCIAFTPWQLWKCLLNRYGAVEI
jgi:hypothetical protein